MTESKSRRSGVVDGMILKGECDVAKFGLTETILRSYVLCDVKCTGQGIAVAETQNNFTIECITAGT